jgi:xanthine dehydrogenase accessory factor
VNQLICRSYLDFFKELKVTDNMYIVLVTRGHQHDIIILQELLGCEAAYVGMVGSRRRISGVFSQLHKQYPKKAFDNIYAPIGLDLGGQTPEEIAIGIIAEILKVKNGRTGISLRERIKYFIAKEDKNERY